MSRDEIQSYIVGILAGLLMSLLIFGAAHIENGFGFFLVAFFGTQAIFWTGVWLMKADKN